MAGLLVGSGVFLLVRVLGGETDWVAAFAKSLFGLAVMISGVLLVSPEIVGWVLLPLHRVLDSIFLPSDSGAPPVSYDLARFYVRQLRHEEACEEYAKIICYHPEQFEACLEGIQVATLAGNEAAIQKFYRAARRTAHTETTRALLAGVYAAHHAAPEPMTTEEVDALPETSP